MIPSWVKPGAVMTSNVSQITYVIIDMKYDRIRFEIIPAEGMYISGHGDRTWELEIFINHINRFIPQ